MIECVTLHKGPNINHMQQISISIIMRYSLNASSVMLWHCDIDFMEIQ